MSSDDEIWRRLSLAAEPKAVLRSSTERVLRRALGSDVDLSTAEQPIQVRRDPGHEMSDSAQLACSRSSTDRDRRIGELRGQLVRHGIPWGATVPELGAVLAQRLVDGQLGDAPEQVAAVMRLAEELGQADALRASFADVVRRLRPELLAKPPDPVRIALLEDLRRRITAKQLVERTTGATLETDEGLYNQTLESAHRLGEVDRLETLAGSFLRKDHPELAAKAGPRTREEPYPYLRLLADEEMGGWYGTAAEHSTALSYLYRGGDFTHPTGPEQRRDEVGDVADLLVHALRHPDANTPVVVGMMGLTVLDPFVGAAVMLGLLAMTDGKEVVAAARERADEGPERLNRAVTRLALGLLTTGWLPRGVSRTTEALTTAKQSSQMVAEALRFAAAARASLPAPALRGLELHLREQALLAIAATAADNAGTLESLLVGLRDLPRAERTQVVAYLKTALLALGETDLPPAVKPVLERFEQSNPLAPGVAAAQPSADVVNWND